MKIRDVLKMLRADGWTLIRTTGSHRIFAHPKKSGTVTVAGHPSAEIAQGTLKSIRKQAGLKD